MLQLIISPVMDNWQYIIYLNDALLATAYRFWWTFQSEITVDSHYLEVEGTRWNSSRYPYFDISDVQNWGKYQTNNQISHMNM